MSRRKKKLAFLLGAVTALLVTVVVVESMAWSHVRGRLLDGGVVVLEKVSYGTNHTSPTASMEGLLRRLPVEWRRGMHWSPSPGRISTSALPIFTFWLNFSSAGAATRSISYVVADEHGFEAPMLFTGPYGSYSPGGFSKDRAGMVCGTGNFPRRSTSFFLRLYQQDGNGERVRVAEFPVRSAGVQSHPNWKPDDLPIERQTNGFAFTLERAEVGVTPPGPVAAPYNAQGGQWSEFRFAVSAEGRRCAGWSVNEIVVSDQDGNQLRQSSEDLGAFNRQLSRAERDEIVWLHRWYFWPGEPAWRLRVHFEQSTNSGCWIEYLVRPRFLNLVPKR